MNRRAYMGGLGFGSMLTPGVKGLLIANGAVFLLQQYVGNDLIYLFGLTPSAVWKELAVWQPVTYMFVHASRITHILFNMLILWMFGSTLESVWGTKQFLRYYFLTGIGAGLSNCLLTPNATTVIIGASGAIYGLLAAYGLLFPNSIIYIYFLFPIRAKYLVMIFGGLAFISSLGTIVGSNGNVAHIVHLGGMVIGVAYLKRGEILRWAARKAKGYTRTRLQGRVHRQVKREDELRREVDDLLDKINEVGIDNLTSWERRRLREASEQLKQMEHED